LNRYLCQTIFFVKFFCFGVFSTSSVALASEVTARQLDAFERIDGTVESLANGERPFKISNSSRKITNFLDATEFMDDVYKLHDTDARQGFRLRRVVKHDHGKNYQFERLINSLPVHGADGIVFVNSHNQVEAAYGLVFADERRNQVLPRLGRRDAASRCEDGFRSISRVPMDWEYRLQLVYIPEGEELTLVWIASATSVDSPVSALCKVDATIGTSEVVERGSRALNRLIVDGTNPANRVTIRTEGGPPSGDLDGDYSYDHLGTFYDYLSSMHGRDSYDNNGITMRSFVHEPVTGSDSYDLVTFSDTAQNSSYHPGSLVHP